VQARLSEEFQGTPAGTEAGAILQRCVHCGFCTATCPTYRLLGDELDGPRGRIHLIKQVLEGESVTASTRLHLDRCLTCRACETTCPSGVQYARLLDIGREVVERKVPRSALQRLARRMLADFLAGPLFAPAVHVGRWVQPLLPARWRPGRRAVQARPDAAVAAHARRMLLVRGCVQPVMAPQIDAAAVRLLARLGITLVDARDSGCCGALHHHLTLPEGALARMRRNVDAWWPLVESGVEAILVTASGCGAMLREYGHLLRNDPDYAQRAARISALARDPVELLAVEATRLADQVPAGSPPTRIAFHAPCSLQHGLRITGAVEGLLRSLGAELTFVADAHACCGSAGTYSLMQPELAERLARAKAQALEAGGPELILTANFGCQRQVATATSLPVRHWIEWVEERLGDGAGSVRPG
jgi:glycolate oxidase iron-sulfur subunit